MFFTLLGNPNATSGTEAALTISNNARNLDLWAWIESQLGGTETTYSTFNITVDSGVVIGSNATGSPAFTTGSFPAGSTLTITNNGTIAGRGGSGGAYESNNGSNGGDAMLFTLDATLVNNGLIGGGGGGGAGGVVFINGESSSGGGGGAGDAVGQGGSPEARSGTLTTGGRGWLDGGNGGALGEDGNDDAGATASGGTAGDAIDGGGVLQASNITNNGTISGSTVNTIP
jgi:hypothetical protein